MMRACRSVGSVLSLILPVGIAAVTGCQTQEAPAPVAASVVKHTPAPMYTESPDMVIMPGTKVGAVASVMPDVTSAAISVDDVSTIALGDVFTLTDRGQNVVANGQVTSISASADKSHTFAVISYKTVSGARQPQVGDIAIRQPKQ